MTLEKTSIGFTGTRKGWSPDQAREFIRIMRRYCGEFHNGYAEGADEDSLRTVDRMGGYDLHIHPPINQTHIASYKPRDSKVIWYEPDTYGEQDRQIVVNSKLMVACPDSRTEKARGSGTWLTVRIARVEFTPLIIIYPDGTMKHERCDNILIRGGTYG